MSDLLKEIAKLAVTLEEQMQTIKTLNRHVLIRLEGLLEDGRQNEALALIKDVLYATDLENIDKNVNTFTD